MAMTPKSGLSSDSLLVPVVSGAALVALGRREDRSHLQVTTSAARGERSQTHPARRRGARMGVAVGAASAVVVLAGSGTAWAYFRGGSGSGAGSASPAAAPTISTGTPTVVGTLYPGGTADLQVPVTNPMYQKYGLAVTGLAGTITITAANGCTPTGVTLNKSASVSNGTLAVGTQTQTVTFTAAVSMDTTSDTACQGTTFTISGIVVNGQEG